jgi:hypothetical protein
MRAVTEFPAHVLIKGLNAKAALLAEGKTPEETQESLGLTFKFEGDKLKYFMNALTCAEANKDGLCHLRVLKFGEGETVPPKAMLIDELHYVPEFPKAPNTKIATKHDKKDKGPKKGRGEKESPWGLSPEQKAAKKAGGAARAAAATATGTKS